MNSQLLIQLAYLAAAVLLILGMRGLGSAKTAPRGNLIASVGMLIAIVAPLLIQEVVDYTVIFAGIVVGSGIGVVLADTAGRLQSKTNLMDELRKIKRVVGRLDAAAPHEVLLVLDAGVGQNALSQVAQFDAAVGLTGLVITKLDGSARAGILFAIARRFDIPVYFVGVGEQLDDLQPFDADDFVAALLDHEPQVQEP